MLWTETKTRLKEKFGINTKYKIMIRVKVFDIFHAEPPWR